MCSRYPARCYYCWQPLLAYECWKDVPIDTWFTAEIEVIAPLQRRDPRGAYLRGLPAETWCANTLEMELVQSKSAAFDLAGGGCNFSKEWCTAIARGSSVGELRAFVLVSLRRRSGRRPTKDMLQPSCILQRGSRRRLCGGCRVFCSLTICYENRTCHCVYNETSTTTRPTDHQSRR